MSIHKRKDGYYYIKFRDASGRQRTKGFGRGEEAKKQALQFEAKDDKKIVPQLTLNKLLPNFQAYLRLNNRSERYIKDMARILDKSNLGDVLLNQFTLECFECFNDKNHITKQRYLSYIKIMLNYAILCSHIDRNPLRFWKKQKEQPRQSRLTLEDVRKIQETALAQEKYHLFWAIEVALNLGVRVGETELCNLKWENVDFDHWEIRVFARKTKEWRTVPIANEEFLRFLRCRKAFSESEYIVDFRGKQIRRFHKSWKNTCKKAGLGYNSVFYEVRHLFASSLLRAGADIGAVSKLMGHHSVKMTLDVYNHVIEGQKRDAMRLLNQTLQHKNRRSGEDQCRSEKLRGRLFLLQSSGEHSL